MIENAASARCGRVSQVYIPWCLSKDRGHTSTAGVRVYGRTGWAGRGDGTSTFPFLAIHLLKKARAAGPVVALAAGLPTCFGGYAFAVRRSHLFARSAVIADAPLFMIPIAIQTDSESALPYCCLVNMPKHFQCERHSSRLECPARTVMCVARLRRR